MIGREALRLLPHDPTIMFSLANVLGKLEKYKVGIGKMLILYVCALRKPVFTTRMFVWILSPGVGGFLLARSADQPKLCQLPWQFR